MTYGVPVRTLQQGSVQEIASGGTLLVSAAGSIQIAAGAAFSNAGAQSITGVTTIASGGTSVIAAGGSIQAAGAIYVSGVETIASAGSILVASGGSVQVASGGVIQVASGGSVVLPAGAALNADRAVVGTLTLGGTPGRWAFGTVGLTAGLGTVPTGLGRVLAANANTILGEPPGAGSALFVLVDLSLSAAGSVIYRAGSAAGQFGANCTIAWQAHGT